MSIPPELTEATVECFRHDLGRVCQALDAAIVGQSGLVRDVLTAFLAGGHVLIEGLPGLGKTHLVKGLARCFGMPLSRVQCTPDLMPADITGSEVLVPDEAGRTHRTEFRPGPVFAHLVLVDEVNRAAPKTQAALLEAMQEGQVTCGGIPRRLPQPFWVAATQNPIELEGTYPLPEAQLDRFSFKCLATYPDPDALAALVDVCLDDEPTEHLPQLVSPERLGQMMREAREVVLAERVKQAAAALVLATHPDGAAGAEPARRHVRYGASPRGLQALLRAARVRALWAGRAQVALDDLQAVAPGALRHRLLLQLRSEMDGVVPDAVLQEILGPWRQAW